MPFYRSGNWGLRPSTSWNPAKLGSWCWRLPPSLLPSPIIFWCGLKKPFGNRPFLGQIKSFGLYLNLPIRIDGEILSWKFPRVFPRVWFHQDPFFQAKWCNWCLLIQVLFGNICVGGLGRQLGSPLCHKREFCLPHYHSQELSSFWSACTIAQWQWRW